MKACYFVTPHGFGHAARAAAVMEALRAKLPAMELQIVTTVPASFFKQSLGADFEYIDFRCDVGFVQRSPLVVDIEPTLAALERLYPPPPTVVAEMAERVSERGAPDVVVCDISPFGIAVAAALGVPSVLIENFTWDWIYGGYLHESPVFAQGIAAIAALQQQVTLRLQAEPVSVPVAEAARLPVIVRQGRETRQQLRARLGISESEQVVLVSLGGIPGEFSFLSVLQQQPGVTFMIGMPGEGVRREGNCIFFAPQSELYHPDLVAASDLVVGKLGYSTVAEVCAGAARFLFLDRPEFREAAKLKEWMLRRGAARELSAAQFQSGEWVSWISEICREAPPRTVDCSGAALAAEKILAVARA